MILSTNIMLAEMPSQPTRVSVVDVMDQAMNMMADLRSNDRGSHSFGGFLTASVC